MQTLSHYRLLKKNRSGMYKIQKVYVSFTEDYDGEVSVSSSVYTCDCTFWLPYQEAKEMLAILSRT